jgi:DNA-binding IclR family transcriptional regulator
VTAEEISVAAGTHPAETAKLLAELERQGKLRRKVHADKTFYTATGNPDET